jgi:hypothetical protein
MILRSLLLLVVWFRSGLGVGIFDDMASNTALQQTGYPDAVLSYLFTKLVTTIKFQWVHFNKNTEQIIGFYSDIRYSIIEVVIYDD